MLQAWQQLRTAVASTLLGTTAARPLTSLSQLQLRLQLQHPVGAFHTSTSVAAGARVEDLREEIDNVNDMFTDARMDIDDAREDAESTYFDESASAAQQSVAQALNAYQFVLDKLEDKEREKLQRSMGLKMEQLKAELNELNNLHS